MSRKCYINKRKVKAILIGMGLFPHDLEFKDMLERYKGIFIFVTKQPHVVMVQGDDYRSVPVPCLKFVGCRT